MLASAKEQLLEKVAARDAVAMEKVAQAMVEPIKVALDYRSVARKLFLVDELVQGALPRYEIEPTATAWVVSRRGSVPQIEAQSQELLVWTFEIATNPMVRIQELKARRYYMIDRIQLKAKDAILRTEDWLALQLMANAAENTISVAGSLSPSDLNAAIATIQSYDVEPAAIVMHPTRYQDILNMGYGDVLDQASRREVRLMGIVARFSGVEIHTSTMCPPNTVLVTGQRDMMGVMPIRQDITVLPADEPRQLSLGWVIYEEIGLAVIQPRLVVALNFS